MEIALYLPSLRGGGAERAIVTLANGISDRGKHVDLVLASAQGPYLNEVAHGVRVVDLASRGVAHSLPKLVRYLRRERPRAMLSALSHANVIAVLARMLARTDVRLVLSERNHTSVVAERSRSFRARCVSGMMRWSYRRAHAITAVSQGVADDLAQVIRLPRDQIEVIYNPVVTPSLLALADKAVDHPWIESNQTPLVLAVGRLTMQKDFGTLIRAFALVHSKRPCRLLILGEGELRESLQDQIAQLGLEDSVQLHGFVENPFAYMRHASLFVLSSAWEGLPNVLIQAMACGAHVVSTDCPSGPREILNGGKWGPMVPVGDVEALARAILAQLDEPLSVNVRERSIFFSVDSAVDAYLRVMSGSVPG